MQAIPKSSQAAFDFAVSLTKVQPITAETARSASKILVAEDTHGHKYAIDAMLAGTAHTEHGDVTVVTSNVDDLRRLCDPAHLGRTDLTPSGSAPGRTDEIPAGQPMMHERGLTEVTIVPRRIVEVAAAAAASVGTAPYHGPSRNGTRHDRWS